MSARPTIRLLAAVGVPIALAIVAPAAAHAAPIGAPAVPSLVALPRSLPPALGTPVAAYASSRMAISVQLAPRDPLALDALLAGQYDSASPLFGRWLARGEFAARFAPGTDRLTAVAAYLRGRGLGVSPTADPFTVRAVGSSAAIEGALGTKLAVYRGALGAPFFANASAVKLPASVAPLVESVVGLTSTIRLLPQHVHANAFATGVAPNATTSCETAYPTRTQLYNRVNNGTKFASGYGGGPGCSGLTPAQLNAAYGAPSIGTKGQGAGVTLALVELSAYQASDVATWAHYYYGSTYAAPVANELVDGGPLAPSCPSSDTCGSPAYAGDSEAVLDIEADLAVSPAAKEILVYEAPLDTTGQTELDELAQIATDDTADVVSSSYGTCEPNAGTSYAQSENRIFQQMASQGQSVFVAAGDSGAYGCLRINASDTNLAENDPATQPYVTSVGGTSFESFNPGTGTAKLPAGTETVWNVDALCDSSSNEGSQTGYSWCIKTGAGGGGPSQFWGAPSYQKGPGLPMKVDTRGNGSSTCVLAQVGTYCREQPDISAVADEFTALAVYCTGSSSTPGSDCATVPGETVPGWFPIGGTSLAAPLMSAIFADRDSAMAKRTGNANTLIYSLYAQNAAGYFNDITGSGSTTNNNGNFTTIANYDMATGVGSPKMSALITGTAQ